MPGIIVGMDGSTHSQRALRRAIKEAAIHNEPLTVIAVHQAVIGYAGAPMTYPQDPAETERARVAAEAETDKALAEAARPGRPRSPSPRCTASRPMRSSTRPRTPTWSCSAGTAPAAWATS